MKPFESVDISGDAGIVAFGTNLGELFENAAAGMYSLITNSESLKEDKSIDVTVEKDSLESLMVAWLNELIFRFDVEGFVAKRIEVRAFPMPPEASEEGKAGPFRITASLQGEEFDPARHEGGLLLKGRYIS